MINAEQARVNRDFYISKLFEFDDSKGIKEYAESISKALEDRSNIGLSSFTLKFRRGGDKGFEEVEINKLKNIFDKRGFKTTIDSDNTDFWFLGIYWSNHLNIIAEKIENGNI